jgi:organic radical activating enzyme
MVMVLPFVETMITQVCNLSCVGCTNYSDLKHKGYVSWQEGRKQIVPWLKRISIPDFGIIGGEPLINPELKDWLVGIRELLPSSQIRFTTNGELLHKHLDIVDLAHELGNIVLKITVHTNSCQVEDTIKKIKNMYDWKSVTEFGIDRFATSNKLRLQITRPTRFIKTYKNSYNDMMPHNSDPNAAFDLCVQQVCPLLLNGKIYKCSTSALLESTLEKFNWPNEKSWARYLAKGIGPNDPDDTILSFIQNFGKAESICGQCPDSKSFFIDHYSTVTVK